MCVYILRTYGYLRFWSSGKLCGVRGPNPYLKKIRLEKEAYSDGDSPGYGGSNPKVRFPSADPSPLGWFPDAIILENLL